MKQYPKPTAQAIALSFLAILWMNIHSGCNSSSGAPVKLAETSIANATNPEPIATGSIADAATIISKTQVPILCYHQVRDYRPTDGPMGKAYTVPPARFAEQMKILADNGYHAVLPDQVYDYLTYGKELPSKPVMITFDDTRLDQYTAALPELDKHDFKAAFFIMTVSLGRPGYMSKEQVKELSDKGHTIGSHTWDHHNVKKYVAEDWTTQIEKPSKQLEAITGKPVEYFAYPFGLWNKEAIKNLKRYKFKSVFQLADPRDQDDPLYSIRRIIVPGAWSADAMIKMMNSSFK